MITVAVRGFGIEVRHVLSFTNFTNSHGELTCLRLPLHVLLMLDREYEVKTTECRLLGPTVRAAPNGRPQEDSSPSCLQM